MDSYGNPPDVRADADPHVVGLSDIFQSLTMQGQRGSLRVSSGIHEKLIYFGDNEVAVVTRIPKTTLGKRLLAAERISDLELEQATALAKKGNGLAEVLLEHMLISEEDLDTLCYALVMDEIYDLFYWQRPTFEFFRDHVPKPVQEDDPTLPRVRGERAEQVLENLRTVDEWDYIVQAIPSVQEVFAPVQIDQEMLDSLELEASVIEASALVDGRHSIEQVAASSMLSELEVSRLVYELLCYGAVEIMSESDLRPAAHRHMKRKRFKEAFELFTLLHAREPENTSIRWRLAECAAQSGRLPRALVVYEGLREHYAKLEDKRRLYQVIMRILDLAPERRRELAAQLRKLRGKRTRAGRGLLRLTVFSLLVALFLFYSDRIFSWAFANLQPIDPSTLPHNQAEAAQRLLSAAEQAEARGALPSAFQLRMLAWRAYPQTDVGQRIASDPNAGLPLAVRCVPEGLLGRLNGREVGPLRAEATIVRYSPAARVLVEVEDGGLIVHSEQLDGMRFHDVRIDLRERPTWIVQLHAGFETTPLIWEQRIYAVDRSGTLVSAELGGFTPLVRQTRLGLVGHTLTAPLIWEGLLICGDSRGSLISCEPESLTVLTSRIDVYPLVTPPIPLGPYLLLGSRRGRLGQMFLYRPGDRLRELSSSKDFGWCVAQNGMLFGNSPDGSLFAIQAKDGTSVWRKTFEDAVGAPMLIADSLVCSLSTAGRLSAFDAQDGSERWSVSLDAPCTLGPQPLDGDVLVATADGQLTRLAGSDGAVVWNCAHEPQAWFFSAPLLQIGGELVFAQADGQLYFLASNNGEVVRQADWTTGELLRISAFSGPSPTQLICTAVRMLTEQVAVFGTNDGRLVLYQLEERP